MSDAIARAAAAGARRRGRARGGGSLRDAAPRRRSSQRAALARRAVRALHRLRVRVDEAGERTCLVEHAKLGRLLQPGGHIEADDVSLEAAALREAREETALELELHPTAPRPFDLDIHEIPERPGRAGALPPRRPLPARRARRAVRGRCVVCDRRGRRRVGRPARRESVRSASESRKPGAGSSAQRALGQPGDRLGHVEAVRRDVVRRVGVEERGEQLDLVAARRRARTGRRRRARSRARSQAS